MALASDIPGRALVSGTPGTPGIPDIWDRALVSGTPDIPDIWDRALVSGTPDTAVVSDKPGTPDTALVSDKPGTPDRALASDTPGKRDRALARDKAVVPGKQDRALARDKAVVPDKQDRALAQDKAVVPGRVPEPDRILAAGRVPVQDIPDTRLAVPPLPAMSQAFLVQHPDTLHLRQRDNNEIQSRLQRLQQMIPMQHYRLHDRRLGVHGTSPGVPVYYPIYQKIFPYKY
ncbi:hypothetical protein LAD12857_47610 [Lacrimispora amygdalina]|uniref:Uncharacterized protein n=1 Tax=Lacrimispora amygdalina TaxID=253257 RepID=A0ABQ5MD98_9FIRM